MRHSQLRAFHYVAHLGGFSKAAEVLHLTQPAVSEQVKNLEVENDVLLFERKKRQVVLTSAGEELFHLTKQYFDIETQIGEYLSERNAAVSGELRIVADSAQHVTDVLAKFRANYPNVRISLRSGNSEEILDQLRQYNAEIGVVGQVPTSRELTSLSIGASEIIAFARRGTLKEGAAGMTMQQIAQYPLIFREERSRTRQMVVDEAAKLGVALEPAIVAEGREAVRSIVLSGGGIGFVSEAEYSHDDRIEQIPILNVDTRMPESIVHLAQRGEVRVIRSFMDLANRYLSTETGGPE
ncbi:LysR substrate-binding domain-containing protein [Shimia aestuarii]|uniref:Aminoethylphosphonate catabolism associated LysR family transcriptional regulator n=1 Tax=Shimia aestuarii TaxID=254406 RepID=A0A1I4SSH0_9RHOB|nr:LysR substrate-binding domain-containing protein [Shimia aestuarii]SFM67361.1 aminoethylphosphonate catabolism associated LysR family transcriptional regulator [Shimia aestuarii]